MKKILLVLLLTTMSVKAFEECNACWQANNFPDKFHFVKAHTHGAPVESVATICDCDGNKYVIIAGYNNHDCHDYPKSIRAYKIEVSHNNDLQEMNIVGPDLPDFLFSVTSYCLVALDQTVPYFTVVGCPDENGNVLWTYRLSPTIPDTWEFVSSWGANENPKPAMLLSIAGPTINCFAPYGDQQILAPQVAVAGKAVNNIAKVYVLQFDILTQQWSTLSTKELSGGDIFALAWLQARTPTSISACTCNIPCNVLSVGGKYLEGEDCKLGNIHNFTVDCFGNINEIVEAHCNPMDVNCGGVLTLGGPDYTVRRLVWSDCCDKYPYPFLLATGDHEVPGYPGLFESKVLVYYYNPAIGKFKELAYKVLPGKIFAGQFTPNCECKSVTVGGGCFLLDEPCKTNIWSLSYDCPKNCPKPMTCYPVEMQIKATSSFNTTTPGNEVITSLAFCPEGPIDNPDCWSMIVSSESKDFNETTNLNPLCPATIGQGEIGMYKVFFCKEKNRPCRPTPICARKTSSTPSRPR